MKNCCSCVFSLYDNEIMYCLKDEPELVEKNHCCSNWQEYDKKIAAEINYDNIILPSLNF